MKKIALFVSALLICGMAKAQYFCTKNGTELHYVNYDEAGQSISNVTTTVKNVTNEDSKTVTTKTQNNTSYSLTQWSYDGNNTVCTEDLMYELYIASDSDPAKYGPTAKAALQEDRKFDGNNSFTLSDNAKAGESMPDRSYKLILNMLKNEINISGAAYMGNETVSTTAGKFDCIKISYLKRTKIVLKTTTLRITEWYAKGVGLVKSEAYDTKGKSYGKTLLTKIVK
ncbi:MAG: hypothetical protein H9777_06100 [Candidatus Phocaeicola faecigallinarum]|uniref:DUF3108 domain-containing protein n=1 Tax=Candidatus Phocaeicola faecigallinarum TaxID=2838732 RepID=A0A948TBD3_9BACT|nr:hypothetical protein [Candidatus Phocaeicola faecigallinarum]